jgi:low temperature requirement protein LtrA
MFAVIWAWIQFSWFASAFDTDDWAYRLLTMAQMVGVTVLALGLPPLFHSLDAGHGIDSRVMVAGYVIMRLAMVSQWIRAAGQSPRYRDSCLTYARFITIAQVFWVVLALLHLPFAATAAISLALFALEMAGPHLAERRSGGGTPWHAHHISERYGLLAIIALGEGVVGTVASLGAIVDEQGWTLSAALVVIAGMGLTFGMWWVYFITPVGEILHARRRLSFVWGYGSIVVLAAIAATGAGLHVAALYIEHQAHIDAVATVLALAVPVFGYLLSLYLLNRYLIPGPDLFHLVLAVITAAVLVAAPLLAAVGMSMAVCLLVVMLAPWVTVVGFELRGHRHTTSVLERILAVD